MVATSAPRPGLVSVVVPTYGRNADRFRAAVESVAQQTYDPIELVVVDDSPDAVSAPLDDAGLGLDAVRCIRDGDHEGPAGARNTGIDAARGEFVAFLDDDDRWLPSKVARQVERFRAGDGVGAVVTGLKRVRDDEVVSVARPADEGDVTRSILVGRPLPPFSALMVRRRFVDEAGPIDERLAYLEDREWCLRLSQHCAFGAVDDPLVVYGLDESDRLTGDYEAARAAVDRFVGKHRSTAAAYGGLTERRFVAALSRTLVTSALSAGEFADARRFALRALRAYPFDPEGYAYLLATVGGRATYVPLQRVNRAASRLRHAFRRLVG
jgi:glycosyltransferase involved in cell wall biosynthesis